MNTKEKILYEALNLFSVKGFNAISVRDIAKAVGIKASSLYNHFKNKQDIFDTIVGVYSEYISKFLSNMLLVETDESDIMLDKIKWADDQFFIKSLDTFKFCLQDEYIVKFRKLLTIEQFNNSKIANLYCKLFINDVLNFQSKIFEGLMTSNILIRKDPYILALQFYSPVFLLFYKQDSITDNDISSLKKHITEFKDMYTLKG
ncbi:TetR/AcrR family transcriptional regulator [Clostridium sp. C2-6-12]|uniref:TetR/AcrR family transcriptional regulator n=1 Tax=Clostridium sp. C2-6-12 TaxID=2698832 RepID=UPI00136E3D07|nr:TetR/AcrR family transcriptional regulator [Clostridium sp. C2-6-12]